MSNSRIRSFVAAAACVAVVALAAGQTAPKYPQTRKGDQVDSYGGITVQDPYRWLEDLDTPEVAAWVAAQNAVTSDYLAKLPMREHSRRASPSSGTIRERRIPVPESGRIFYRRNIGPAAAGAALRAHRSRGRAGAGPRSERRVGRRIDVARRLRPVARRESCWPTRSPKAAPTGRRSTCATRARQGPRRRSEVDAVLRPVVDEGREGLLLLALSRAAARARCSRRRCPARRSTTTASARRSRRTCWSTSGKDLPTLVRRRLGHRGRPLPARVPRRRARTTTASTTPTSASRQRPRSRRPVKPVVEADDAEYAPFGNKGSLLFLRTDATRPNRKVIAIDLRAPEPVSVEDDRPRARSRRSRASRSSAAARRAVPRRRAEPAAAVRLSTAAPEGDVALPGTGGHWPGSADARTRPTIFYAFTLAARFRPRSFPTIRRRSKRDAVRSGDAADRRQAVRDEGAVRHLEGRHARAVLPDGAEGPAARRQQPDDAVRLRRLFDQHAADLSSRRAGLARAGRHLGDGQHARRRRVRRGVAQGRHAREEAERLRRLHRRRRASGQREIHVAGEARRSWAARTAACSWARSWSSGRICSPSRCRRSA